MAQWATFLRNHDELDLSRLTSEQRADVFAEFAPQQRTCACTTEASAAGWRRCCAATGARIELAYSLQFSMPGTPVLRYGEEIGMGENLDAARAGTPSGRRCSGSPASTAGFSTAAPEDLLPPAAGAAQCPRRSATCASSSATPTRCCAGSSRSSARCGSAPRSAPASARCSTSTCRRPVLAHRFDAPEGSILFLHNLGAEPVRVDLGRQTERGEAPFEVFADGPYDAPGVQLQGLELRPWGYRWLRLRRGRSV